MKSHILGSKLTTDNQRIRITKDNQVEPAENDSKVTWLEKFLCNAEKLKYNRIIYREK